VTLQLVIVDDHSVVLDGLKALFALEPDIEVSAFCTDGLEAIEAVKHHRPDVLVMDLAMPRCGGLEVYELLRDQGLHVPTVFLTATMDDETLVGCLRFSVDGIVLKESVASVLIDAVRAVARGERWIPPELTARALELVTRKQVDDEGTLTVREMDVIVRVAKGLPNKRVATALGIAESTVKLHLHSAFTKLGVSNRTQLSLLARERGWL
jgi:DNA-binding NarL/FixJ family response regulator